MSISTCTEIVAEAANKLDMFPVLWPIIIMFGISRIFLCIFRYFAHLNTNDECHTSQSMDALFYIY